jgi:predicted aspartyl protease
VYNDVPLVNCNLNGNKAVPFLVDTGASTNILDHEYAKAIGILPTSEEYCSLQGHPIRDALIGELNIGTFVLENLRTRVMNIESVLGGDCPAKGILGYPVFRRIELCINYPKRTVSFREGAYGILEQSFEPVLTFVIIPVWIENQGPFSFILDTGCNMSLVEAHVLAELNPPIEETVPVVRMKMHGPGEAFCWIRKGSRHDISNVRSEGISDAREYVRRAYGIRIDGVLGWRHMKDYKIIINYPTCTYQFEKIDYPTELKPVVVNVMPDLSKDVHLSIKEIIFEFSVPMRKLPSYLSTFECEQHWQDDKHLKLTIMEELEVDKEYEIILGHGFRSKKDVPLDWSTYKFKVVSNK